MNGKTCDPIIILIYSIYRNFAIEIVKTIDYSATNHYGEIICSHTVIVMFTLHFSFNKQPLYTKMML